MLSKQTFKLVERTIKGKIFSVVIILAMLLSLVAAALPATIAGAEEPSIEPGSGKSYIEPELTALEAVGPMAGPYAHNSLIFTINDVVFFSYEDGTMLELYDSTGTLVWDNGGAALNKGEHAHVVVATGVYKASGSNKFAVLTGDPITRTVCGYYAMDQEGYGASTELYTWVPSHEWDGEKFIVFAYTDNTNVTISYTDTGVVIWSGTLNTGEHHEVTGVYSSYLHVVADNPVSALTYFDQGYFVPSANQKFSGTEFYTYVGTVGGWTEDLSVIAYNDNTSVSIDETGGANIWSGIIDDGQVHVESFTQETYVTVTSDQAVTVTVQPWVSWTSNYHQGAYVQDASGAGIGTDLIGPTQSDATVDAYLYILAYKDGTTAQVYNSQTGALIATYALNAGEYVEANPGNGLWRIISNLPVSAYSGGGEWNADFAPVEFGEAVVIARITLDPTSGPGGTKITVTGENFAADSDVTITFDGTPVGTAHTDANGDFSTEIAAPCLIPVSMGGERSVVEATDEEGNTASAEFEVTRGIHVNPDSGSPCTDVSICGTGFFANEKFIEVIFSGADGLVYEIYGPFTANADGAWESTMHIPDGPCCTPYWVDAFGQYTRAYEITDVLFTIVPKITIDPTEGPYCTWVTVTGKGFSQYEMVDIFFDGGWIGTAGADELGNFEFTFHVPLAANGEHDIMALGYICYCEAHATYMVTGPWIEIDPTEGTVCTFVTVYGYAFAANDTGITVTWDGNIVAGDITAEGNGSWSTVIHVDENVCGPHEVDAYSDNKPPEEVEYVIFTVIPSIIIEPNVGWFVDPLVIGTGFAGNSEIVSITFDGVEATYPPTLTDVKGSFTADVQVPVVARGWHTVRATDAEGNWAETSFLVDGEPPIIWIDPEEGVPCCTDVTVYGKGYYALESVDIFFDGGLYGWTLTDENGCFEFTFHVPQRVAGDYVIQAFAYSSGPSNEVIFTAIPGIRVEPVEGVPQILVRVIGCGFAEYEGPIKLVFPYGEAGEAIIWEGWADEKGSWTSDPYVIPCDMEPCTWHWFKAFGPYTYPVYVEFHIAEQGISLDPYWGTVDSEVLVKGFGFPEYCIGINVILYNYEYGVEEVFGPFAADEYGNWTAIIVIPEVRCGEYIIDAYGQGKPATHVPDVVFTVVPGIWVDPTEGPYCTWVTVTGKGFCAYEYVTWSFPGYGGGVSTDGSGSFQFEFHPVQLPNGDYEVTAYSYCGVATATFHVTPQISVVPDWATVCTWIGVYGTGFAANDTGITITWDGTVVADGISADSNGSWGAEIHVDENVAGEHTIDAYSDNKSAEDVPDVTVTVIPAITVTPNEGSPQDIVTVDGTGFAADSGVTIWFNDIDVTPMILPMTDGVGSFSADVEVPILPALFSVIVTAEDAEGNWAQTGFNVGPAIIEIFPEEGVPCCTDVTVIGKGWFAYDFVFIYFDEWSMGEVFADENGYFEFTFHVPPCPAGDYVIDAWGMNGGWSNEVIFTAIPGIRVEPVEAPPWSHVTVIGCGFGENEPGIKLIWCETIVMEVGSADGNGSWSYEFLIPWEEEVCTIKEFKSFGYYTDPVYVDFHVCQGIAINCVDSGTVGSELEIRGAGFPANEPGINVVFIGEGVEYYFGPFSADANGRWIETIIVPEGPCGWYIIDAYSQEKPADHVPDVYFEIVPGITLDPTEGPYCTVITVYGKGYCPYEWVWVYFSAYGAIGYVQANELGSWETGCHIGELPNGDYEVWAESYCGEASATFHVTPKVWVDPNEGTVCTWIDVYGTGFAIYDTGITITWDGTVVADGINANTNGSWWAVIHVDENVAGPHTIDAYSDNKSAEDVEEATFTVIPKITVTPNIGSPQDIVTVDGTGFAANSGVSIWFDGIDVTPMIMPMTDGVGSFSADIEVPIVPTGWYWVTAGDAEDNWADTEFEVVPKIELYPDTGVPCCTDVTVIGKGWYADEWVDIWFDEYYMGQIQADENGYFEFTFHVPPCPAGEHYVYAEGWWGAGATFTAIPGIRVNTDYGDRGTEVEIIGCGFVENEIGIKVKWCHTQIIWDGWADENGSWSCLFTIPEEAATGPCVFDAYGYYTTAASVEDFTFYVTPAVHNLTQDTWHATIQGAIDAASPGDELVVYPETYSETVLAFRPDLVIKSSHGAEVTIIDTTGWTGDAVTISGDGVTFGGSGFTVTGAELSGIVVTASNCTIEDNIISGSGLHGIDMTDTAQSNKIINNRIEGNGRNAIRCDGDDNEFYYNTLSGNGFWGVVLLSNAEGNLIYWNNIAGNALGGVQNIAAAEADARLNWWGDISGPAHASNPGGIGDRIDGDVLYSPWLGIPYPPPSPMVFCVNPTGSIQFTINSATDGDTILVHPGTYPEKVLVDRSLTIKSTDGAEVTIIDTTGLPGYAVQIRADGVTFGGSGFTVTGAALSGISLLASDCTVQDNIIQGNLDGIYLGSIEWGAAYNNRILNNQIIDNARVGVEVNEDYNELDGNVISGSGAHGVDLAATAQFNTITNNRIEGSSRNAIRCDGDDNEIYYNTLSGNGFWGVVLLSNAEGNLIYWNNIAGNALGGVQNVAAVVTDARFNWWGHASGPFHAVTNPGGLGNKVSDNVIYSPWLGFEVGTSPMTFHVNQAGYPFYNIQAAIDAAQSGDTILVHPYPGTYTENLEIEGKSLTVQSTDGPEVTPIDTLGAEVGVYIGWAPGTIFQGFWVYNCYTGIYAEYSDGVQLLDNIIDIGPEVVSPLLIEEAEGIIVGESAGAVVSGNTVNLVDVEDGIGILLYRAPESVIAQNTILILALWSAVGIVADYCEGVEVSGNNLIVLVEQIDGETWAEAYGMYAGSCPDAAILANIIIVTATTDSGPYTEVYACGIEAEYCENLLVSGNDLTVTADAEYLPFANGEVAALLNGGEWWVEADGIVLYDCCCADVTGNNVDVDATGIIPEEEAGPEVLDLPPLLTETFPVDSFVIPMDEKQTALTPDDVTVYGFVWSLLDNGAVIYRIIEPPDVTLYTTANPGGAVYSGGPILVMPGDSAIVGAVQPSFPTVTVDHLTQQFVSDQVFRVEHPTNILVIWGEWGHTQNCLDWMGIPYDLVNTWDVEANPSMLMNYNLVVDDCPGWWGSPPAPVADAMRTLVSAGGEIFFTDIALEDLPVVFPGYVSVVGNEDGVWPCDIHNPPLTGFPGEYPSQYPATFPSTVSIYTMGSGNIVDSVLAPDQVRVWMDCPNYGYYDPAYRILGFYFPYGNGIVEGMAYHPQEQTYEWTGDPDSFVAGTLFYGNKFTFATAPPPPPMPDYIDVCAYGITAYNSPLLQCSGNDFAVSAAALAPEGVGTYAWAEGLCLDCCPGSQITNNSFMVDSTHEALGMGIWGSDCTSVLGNTLDVYAPNWAEGIEIGYSDCVTVQSNTINVYSNYEAYGIWAYECCDLTIGGVQEGKGNTVMVAVESLWDEGWAEGISAYYYCDNVRIAGNTVDVWCAVYPPALPEPPYPPAVPEHSQAVDTRLQQLGIEYYGEYEAYASGIWVYYSWQPRVVGNTVTADAYVGPPLPLEETVGPEYVELSGMAMADGIVTEDCYEAIVMDNVVSATANAEVVAEETDEVGELADAAAQGFALAGGIATLYCSDSQIVGNLVTADADVVLTSTAIGEFNPCFDGNYSVLSLVLYDSPGECQLPLSDGYSYGSGMALAIGLYAVDCPNILIADNGDELNPVRATGDVTAFISGTEEIIIEDAEAGAEVMAAGIGILVTPYMDMYGLIDGNYSGVVVTGNVVEASGTADMTVEASQELVTPLYSGVEGYCQAFGVGIAACEMPGIEISNNTVTATGNALLDVIAHQELCCQEAYAEGYADACAKGILLFYCPYALVEGNTVDATGNALAVVDAVGETTDPVAECWGESEALGILALDCPEIWILDNTVTATSTSDVITAAAEVLPLTAEGWGESFSWAAGIVLGEYYYGFSCPGAVVSGNTVVVNGTANILVAAESESALPEVGAEAMASAEAVGIMADYCDGIQVDNNTVTAYSSADASTWVLGVITQAWQYAEARTDGILLIDCYYATVNNNTVLSARADVVGLAALVDEEEPNEVGIYLIYCDWAEVNGNTVTDTGVGILLVECAEYVTLAGNTVYDCSLAGICLIDCWGDMMLFGNSVSNCPAGIVIEEWMYDATAEEYYDVILEDNTVSACSEVGILVSGWYSVWLCGNSVSGCGDGIVLDETSDNTLKQNEVTGCSGTGIHFIYTCYSNWLHSNTVTGCDIGIHFQGCCWDNLLELNTIADNRIGVLFSEYWYYYCDAGVEENYYYLAEMSWNDIAGNSEYGVLIETTDSYDSCDPNTLVEAPFNWWNDPRGPSCDWLSIVAGDAISQGINYVPWLTRDKEVVLAERDGYFGIERCCPVQGWSTLSTPLYLENDTLGGIIEPGLMDVAYRYNSELQQWELIDSTYVLNPLDAVFVHTTALTKAKFLFNTDAPTVPPERELDHGWNFLSIAPPWMQGPPYYSCEMTWPISHIEALGSIDCNYVKVFNTKLEFCSGDWHYGVKLYDEETEEYYWLYNPEGEPDLSVFVGYWVLVDEPSEEPCILQGWSTTPVGPYAPWPCEWDC